MITWLLRLVANLALLLRDYDYCYQTIAAAVMIVVISISVFASTMIMTTIAINNYSTYSNTYILKTSGKSSWHPARRF